MNFPLSILILLLSLPVILAASEFDFIVVGAGTSGCALASRLCTQLPQAKILLLERGIPRDAESEFLVRAMRNILATLANPDLTEVIPTLPNPGLNNRVVNQFAGNTLGGSSSINGVQWTVPTADSINRWRIRGLNSRTSQKFYQRAFDQLQVSIPLPQDQQQYTSIYINASNAAGFPNVENPFDMKVREGIWPQYVAAENGRRRDSCTAYLTPVIDTSCANNLVLMQGVTVTKILTTTDESSGMITATGVEYVESSDRTQSSVKTAKAASEVLIAAGPFGSPKLLQLSGIGPRDLLNQLNIDEVLNLPVGQKTQGRTFATSVYRYENLPVPPENDPAVLADPAERAKFERGEPSVFNIPISLMNAAIRRISYTTATFALDFPNFIGMPLFNHGCLLTAKSFGWLRIKSKDPFEIPEINLNLLSKKAEAVAAVKCLKRLDDISNQFPNLLQVTPSQEDLGEDFVRENANTGLHFVGGCPVGQVLTSDLMVKGIKALRVVDSSVMNQMPVAAGPMASTFMIAEYAADMIVDSYKRKLKIK